MDERFRKFWLGRIENALGVFDEIAILVGATARAGSGLPDAVGQHVTSRIR